VIVDPMEKKDGKLRLSDKAYSLIREMIVTLQLSPGKKIEEGFLEQRLSIGRTPVREALQRLAMEGLLAQTPGRGLIVRPVSIDDVKNIFEAMTALEQIVVQLATQRIRKEEIELLAQISRDHQKAMKKKDFLAVTMFNKAFHRGYCTATGNSFLIGALDSLSHQTERLAYLTHTREALPEGVEDYNTLAIQDHELLLECFIKADSERAVEIIAAHCRRFFLRVCHYMEPRVSLRMPRLEAESKLHSDEGSDHRIFYN